MDPLAGERMRMVCGEAASCWENVYEISWVEEGHGQGLSHHVGHDRGVCPYSEALDLAI